MPADQSRRRAADAVLGAIDATMDGKCACGCGRPLTAAGPSGWFASSSCQTRYQARDATNPVEVWAREDAAQVMPEHDDWPIPLTEPPRPAGREDLAEVYARRIDRDLIARLFDVPPELLSGEEERELRRAATSLQELEWLLDTAYPTTLAQRADPLREPAYASTLYEPSPPAPPGAPAHLRFVRWCQHCQRQHVPILHRIIIPPAMPNWMIDPTADYPVETEVRDVHMCSNCMTPFPTPALYSRVGGPRRSTGHYWMLGLTDDPTADQVQVVHLSYEVAARWPDGVAQAWRELEYAIEERRRPLCSHPECSKKGRRRYEVVGRRGAPALRRWGQSWMVGTMLVLCPEHEADVLRDLTLMVNVRALWQR